MKILVPTDFSNNAWDVLLYSTNLLANITCNFILIHTYQIPNTSDGEIIDINDKIRSESCNKLIHIINKIQTKNQNEKHSFTHLAIIGDFPRTIYRLMREEEIDMIAISLTNQCDPEDSIVHNGYAKDVLETTICPVLVVPDCYKEETNVG